MTGSRPRAYDMTKRSDAEGGTRRRVAEAALSLLGPDGIVGDGEWQTLFLTAPSISIRGGTDEIQRNIVGERVLGLPPEPRVDTDKPWDEIPH